MKKSISNLKFISIVFLVLTFGTKANAQETKYGALAIDRNNGFYYGWAYDFSSLTEAENRALLECQNKGGNCHVVLEWSGAGCAAYRTISGEVGSAYGWGLASTKEAADAIATSECLQRSNGKPAINYVWACNSNDPAPLKEIFNASRSNDAEETNTNETVEMETLSFNGSTMEAYGDCPGGNTASLASDDENYFLVINNLPSSGRTNVSSDFYTNGCTNCLAIQFQDIGLSKIYVATSGTVSREGNYIFVNISVQDLFELMEGTGQGYNVTAKIVCVD